MEQLASLLTPTLDRCTTLRAPVVIPPIRNVWYAVNSRMGELQSHSGTFGEYKVFFTPSGHETPDRPAYSLVTTLTNSNLCSALRIQNTAEIILERKHKTQLHV